MRNKFLLAGLLLFTPLPLAGCFTTVHTTELAPDHPRRPADLEHELRHSVAVLTSDIGERNCYRPEKLAAAADWLEARFRAYGYEVARQPVEVPDGDPFRCGKRTVWNIVAEKKGAQAGGPLEEILVVGAHYDSKVAMLDWHGHEDPLPDQPGTPGADDNASGVAGVLAVARMLQGVPLKRTVRFVAFVNEEPPFYHTPSMGSVVCAKALTAECAASKLTKRPKQVVGMISFEMLGMYEPTGGKKRPFGPGISGMVDEPDYLCFLSNRTSRPFVAQCAESFRRHSAMALRSTAYPTLTDKIAWSDDWSFWQEGIQAFSATDTAYCRNDHYHEVTDTFDTLDYPKMAEVVWGLRFVVEDIGGKP